METKPVAVPLPTADMFPPAPGDPPPVEPKPPAAKSKSSKNADLELAAMSSMCGLLARFDEPARRRVLTYVCDRFVPAPSIEELTARTIGKFLPIGDDEIPAPAAPAERKIG